MDMRVTSVAVILMMVLAYGDALKCYKGNPGYPTVPLEKVDCAGSCIKAETKTGATTTVVLGCSPTKSNDTCMGEVATGKACYCSTDLCFKGPTPVSGTVGLSALKITWLMAALIVIGQRYLH